MKYNKDDLIVITFGLVIVNVILIWLKELSIIFISIPISMYLLKLLYKRYRIDRYRQAFKIKSRKSNNTGRDFELACYKKLKREFGESSVLMDILLPKYNKVNEWTEVDIILFHESGIYVLELKDYSGVIVGTKDETYWNVYYPNNDKFDLYNPITQNEGHINVLNYIVDFNYKNYVIFSERSKFHHNIDNVTTIKNLIDVVKNNPKLPGRELKKVKQIYEVVNRSNEYSSFRKELHVLNTNKKYNNQYY